MAAKASKTTTDYQALSAQLDEIMTAMSSSDITIDEALEKYKEATRLIKQMEAHLKSAENTISKLTSEFSND